MKPFSFPSPLRLTTYALKGVGMKILVTGGAGFIGSNFIRFLLAPENRGKRRVVNLDRLTYAGNLKIWPTWPFRKSTNSSWAISVTGTRRKKS